MDSSSIDDAPAQRVGPLTSSKGARQQRVRKEISWKCQRKGFGRVENIFRKIERFKERESIRSTK